MTNPDAPAFNDTAPLSNDGRGAGRGARASLVVYHLGGAEIAALPAGAPVVVGREAPADLVVADRSLSRRHARFTLLAGGVMVEDLGSTNGTFVSGRRVERDMVLPGEVVVLGSVSASVHALEAAEDAVTRPSSHERFRLVLDDEVVRARHFGQPLAVLQVRADGPEGNVARWCARVQALLRPVDRIGLYSADSVEILLPHSGLEQARLVAESIVAGQRDGEPPLVCGIATWPGTAATSEALLEASRSAVRAAGSAVPVAITPATSPPDATSTSPVAASAAMAGLLSMVQRLSRSVVPILLLGETGAGKEIVARLIHESGTRGTGPIVCVNCGALPTQLLESTLFGHERGAFTGATHTQKGVFEHAERGTVLLDEIGELPPPAQAALLRVLETKRIARVGSPKEIEVDVRVLCATHRDLDAMCERGTFREDLLFRLNTITLRVPPLRERVEDVRPLAERFLQHASAANGRNVRALSPEAVDLLERYRWPGNVRELRNAIERAVVISTGDTIVPDDLPDRVRARQAPAAPVAAALVAEADYKSRMARYEVDVLLDALRRSSGSQVAAARLLGMPLRTFKHKLKAFGIRREFEGPR